MKRINLYILTTLLITIFISSCKKDEHKDYSTLVNKNSQLQEFLPSLVSTVESDSVLSFPFELDATNIVTQKFTVKQVSGDATEGDDFDIVTSEVTIDAYRKTGVVQILIHKDDIIEGEETLVLQVGDSLDANASVFKNITIKINDYIGPNLDITFLWNKTVTVPGVGAVPVGPNFDLDFYFVDADGNDNLDYESATGNYPEVHTVSSLVDTTVYIYVGLWENVFRSVGAGLTDLTPITIDFHRDGSLGSFEKTQPDSVSYNLDSPDALNDGDFSLIYMGKIVVSGGTFTFYDTDDTSLFNARRKQMILTRKKSTQTHKSLVR